MRKLVWTALLAVVFMILSVLWILTWILRYHPQPQHVIPWVALECSLNAVACAMLSIGERTRG